ncbi:hypothetical protein AADZ90_014095 [Aestuariibius sp. 2305UL40-4]|uniref:hypothetical protein n=1 Tax=Aestuariibius violaceus TaxID=3234132 RepID=UPI00345E8DD2
MNNGIAFILAFTAAALPVHAQDTTPPGTVSQTGSANYVACMYAVEDADDQFRNTLQSTCLERMGNLCVGRSTRTLPSQAIDCIHFEVRRSVDFLQVAVADLPQNVEAKGFFGHGYPERRSELLAKIEDLQGRERPESLDDAGQQAVAMASAVWTLFWLARETETPLGPHILSTLGAQ